MDYSTRKGSKHREDSECDEEIPHVLKERVSHQSDIDNPFTRVVAMINDNKAPSQVILALSTLKNSDFTSERNRLLFFDVGGPEALLKLLSVTHEARIRQEILKVLIVLANHQEIRYVITKVDGVRRCIDLLNEGPRPGTMINEHLVKVRRQPPISSQPSVQYLAAELLSLLCISGTAKKEVRLGKGITSLLRLTRAATDKSFVHKDKEKVAAGAAKLLHVLASSNRARSVIKSQGGLIVLCDLLLLSSEDLLSEAAGALLAFVSCRDVRTRTDLLEIGLVDRVIGLLGKSTKQSLLQHSADILSFVSNDGGVSESIKACKGVSPIVSLLGRGSRDLVISVCRVVYSILENDNSIAEDFVKANAIPQLLAQVSSHDEDVEVCCQCVRCLSCLFRCDAGRYVLKKTKGGVAALVALTVRTEVELLKIVGTALGEAGTDIEVSKQIRDADGLRLLWSLLKSTDIEVVGTAAHALTALLQLIDVATGAKELVGGLELCCHLLHSESSHVRAYVCGMIARLGKIRANAKVVVEYGVLPLLSNLAATAQDLLVRQYVAEAIASLAPVADHSKQLGELGVVQSLCKYIAEDEELASHTILQHCVRYTEDIVHLGLEKELGFLLADPDGGVEGRGRDIAPWSAIKGRRPRRTPEQSGMTVRKSIPARSSTGTTISSPSPSLVRAAHSILSRLHCVNHATCLALAALAQDAHNAMVVRQSGVVSSLLILIGGKDEGVQESAALAVRQMRRHHIASVEEQDRLRRERIKKMREDEKKSARMDLFSAGSAGLATRDDPLIVAEGDIDENGVQLLENPLYSKIKESVSNSLQSNPTTDSSSSLQNQHLEQTIEDEEVDQNGVGISELSDHTTVQESSTMASTFSAEKTSEMQDREIEKESESEEHSGEEEDAFDYGMEEEERKEDEEEAKRKREEEERKKREEEEERKRKEKEEEEKRREEEERRRKQEEEEEEKEREKKKKKKKGREKKKRRKKEREKKKRKKKRRGGKKKKKGREKKRRKQKERKDDFEDDKSKETASQQKEEKSSESESGNRGEEEEDDFDFEESDLDM
ncbi:hypothetical protein ADUPG1_008588 [Aduncisulcus paluster]|uniref:Uncharacterized protein n=1 Tax=Aduncisulcus paluster TaxID=2918883 RepID=A0ABQ5KVE6_9EUKA|nr:hypothetical protein ADUPG1_008588 [Aduncisulcus paluster]